VVAHHQMDAVGKVELEANHVKEQLVREASSGVVFRAAVDDFLQDEVPVRMVREAGVGDDALVVPSMTVKVAADHQRSLGRGTNEIAAAKLVRLVGLDPLSEKVNGCLCHFDLS